MSNIDILDAIHKNSQIISRISRDLTYKASCHSEVGNDKVAEELYFYSEQLKRVSKEIHSLGGPMVDNYVKSVAEGNQNMMRAMLAGIELGDKK